MSGREIWRKGQGDGTVFVMWADDGDIEPDYGI